MAKSVLWGPADVAREVPGLANSTAARVLWKVDGFPGWDDPLFGLAVTPDEFRAWALARKGKQAPSGEEAD